ALRGAFIGLGVMGYPMASHLARAGHDVTVYNRTSAKAQKWVAEHRGRQAESPAAAAANADMVLACAGRDSDVDAMTRGASGAFRGMKSGAVFIDHTTASAEIARSLADSAQQLRLGFVDAPVS